MSEEKHQPDNPPGILTEAGLLDPKYASPEWQAYAAQHFVPLEPGAEEADSLLETMEHAQTAFEALRWSRRAGDHCSAALEAKGIAGRILEARYGIALLTVQRAGCAGDSDMITKVVKSSNRGAKPGERRGGRKKGTRNKKNAARPSLAEQRGRPH